MSKNVKELDLDIEIKSLEGKIDIIEKCLVDMKRTISKTDNVQEGIKDLEEGVQKLKKDVEEKKQQKLEVRDK